jgi:carbon-monoxide dehydrogenase large subunit
VSPPVRGARTRRIEDRPFVTGTGRYVEDVVADGALHAAFVRSPVAHGRIESIDTAGAATLSKVVGVYTASDLGLAPQRKEPHPPGFARSPLADEVVRFVGEPVLVIVAETQADAVDAAELVTVDYAGLPVVVDPLAALEEDSALLFPAEGTNVVWEEGYGFDDEVLQGAEVVVSGRFLNQRVAPVPMEVSGALAIPSSEGALTMWVPCQAPFTVRRQVAAALGLTEEKVRVVAPSIGGSFGSRIDPYPEQLVVAAVALKLGRPVRFTETRTENMMTMRHGRGQIQDVAIAARRDGTLLGLEVRIVADAGAYPAIGATLPELTGKMASGVYRIPKIAFKATSVVTNTTPVGSYRGAGRPEATALIERIMDMLAKELNVDPVELRRRNFIPKGDFPYTTAAGATYDSGDYDRALEEAIGLAGYPDLRNQQQIRREQGQRKQLGIGISCYIELTGSGSEYAKVEVGGDGRVTVTTGTTPHGQGHETAWAQIVAGVLSVPLEAIQVVHSDTGVVARGDGTMGSRSLQLGGSAVLHASSALLEKGKQLAAHFLQVPVEEVELLPDGRIGSVGKEDCSLAWAELAAAASDEHRIPAGMAPGLYGIADFEQEESTYPFGAHVAVVEVDTETGEVRLLRLAAVDDCGYILNPTLVEGQVQGGIAQGAGQALFEEVLYDDGGNPLTSNLASYSIAGAPDLPSFDTAFTETPTPLNSLGAKGVGESGTIGSTPAIQNAVVDALSHMGVTHIDMPLLPHRVWQAIQEAKSTSTS